MTSDHEKKLYMSLRFVQQRHKDLLFVPSSFLHRSWNFTERNIIMKQTFKKDPQNQNLNKIVYCL